MVVSWFSAGVSSAIATKISIEKYSDVKIIYTHIDDQHPDTMRFIKDCESWFDRPIEILQSPLMNVNNACLKSAFIKSPKGAPCTRLLKIRVRQIWEQDHNEDFTYIWGYDYSETERARRRVDGDIEASHIFPLIENLIDKQAAHGILERAGIKRPAMYDEGYPNNNCIGCLKGGLGYWVKIKKDYPEVFESRCQLEEKIGGRIFSEFPLRQIPEDRGRVQPVIVPDCGLFCDVLD